MNSTMKYIRNVLAAVLLIACLCIFMVGCADTRDFTDPTSEPDTFETPDLIDDTQFPQQTDSVTMPDVSESVSPGTETTPADNVHVHSYTSEVVEPSCTEGGYTTFTCGCGDTYTADHADAASHNYSEKVTAPTCIKHGYTTYTCSVCGISYTGSQTSAAGHNWSGWKVTKQPTTTAEGAEQRTCKACGKTDSHSIAKLPEKTTPTYETFTGTIGIYNAHNLAYKDWKGDTEQAAFIEVYTIEKSDNVLIDLITEFEKFYGFAPSLGDKYRCTSNCEKLGTYMVEGYSEPQTVYHYTITDKTYIYITNDMYEVYVQQCDDGSVWVGYCVYATMDTISTERNKAEVRALDKEMYTTFERLIGLNRSEMNAHKETLDLRIGYISEAGTVRSANAEGLVDVLYIYCRGFAIQ